MSPDLKTLQQRLSTYSLAQKCEPLPDGSFRIVTPLLYPNGTRVEVFYQPELDLFASTRLSDKGQTAALLAELNIYIEGFEKRRQILADICRTLRVGDGNGELFVSVEGDEHLADAVMRLAQACVRAADLHYTQSFRAQSDFRQIFAAFVHQERPDNIEDYTIEGRFGRRIKVDFHTHQGHGRDNLLITLFSANETSSHSVANDVFCRWYDLERYRDRFNFLTVMDSSSRAFRQADVHRVGSISKVLSYPGDSEELRTLIARPKA